MKLQRILVPTDFSDEADHALVTAAQLAHRYGARLVLLHALRTEIPAVFASEGTFAFPAGFQARIMEEAKERVGDAAREIAKQEGVDATGCVSSEPAEVAVLDLAASLPADLIVMGTRGLSGLKHAVLGSIAERVVRLADCPVWTVSAAD